MAFKAVFPNYYGANRVKQFPAKLDTLKKQKKTLFSQFNINIERIRYKLIFQKYLSSTL